MSKRYEIEQDDEVYLKPILPTVPEKSGPPVISLGLLMEFAIQQIYHELTVLSELLPKKLDSDRKISIVRFAHSTRTLFIKLLAVVKWVKSSKKFESCASICYFLDQQLQYFVDTADRLVQISREELIIARLPDFQVPAAIDVLTLGTYPRLPTAIKTRFIPPSELTVREEATVLARLNQVLKTRMSLCAKKLSPHINSIVIKNGMVVLTVSDVFEISLTVLGEKDTTKWTLLNIDILIEDYDLGYGTKLIHPLQLNVLHNALQLRMDRAEDALCETFKFLHAFSLSLQLDVLYCQATQIITGPMRQYTVIEKYIRTQGVLVITYWLKKTHNNRYNSQYRIVILTGQGNGNNYGLRIEHHPAGKSLPKIIDQTIKLSISWILSETILMRCRERLLLIRCCIARLKPSYKISLSGEAAPTLSYQLMGPESNVDEMLTISMNGYSGDVATAVLALSGKSELRELERVLNDLSFVRPISALMAKIRILLIMERYRKCVSSLAVRIVLDATIFSMSPMFEKLPPDRICLQFIREEAFFLIIFCKASKIWGVDLDLHLVSVIDGKVKAVQIHPGQILSSTPSFSFSFDESNETSSHMRRRWTGSTRELRVAIAAIEDRIAFKRLCDELDKRSVKYKSITKESVVGGLLLQINDFSGTLTSSANEFYSSVINCSLRLDTRTRIAWPFECTFMDTPLICDMPSSVNSKRLSRAKLTIMEINGSGGISSLSTSESISANILDRLTIFSHMYGPACDFAPTYYNYYNKYCSILAFTYHKLVIAYGSNRDYLLIISWKSQKTTKPHFYLTFGMRPNIVASRKNNSRRMMYWNPHTLLHHRLQEEFNNHQSLNKLMQYLIETISPLSSLHNMIHMRLHSLRAFCQLSNIEASLPVTAHANLSVINEYTLRLIYGSVHLEFYLVGGCRVGVRDCARGGASAYKLRAFLNKFVSPEMRSMNEERSSGYLSSMYSSSGPGSLPSIQRTCSPSSRITASPLSHPSLSVPPADTAPSPYRISSGEQMRSRSPFLIDHHALMTMTTHNESGTCPFEEYLFSLSYISRLGTTLENHRRDSRMNNTNPVVHFKSLITMQEFIRISVHGTLSSSRYELPSVNLTVYMDDESMALRLRIDLENSSPPPGNEIRIFERYFKRFVARGNCEIAFISFLNVCRTITCNALPSIAKIMEYHMNCPENSPWRPSLQLAVWNQESAGYRSKLSPGIIIDQSNISILVMVCMRSSTRKHGERSSNASKYVIPLVYNTQTNGLTLRSNDDDIGNVSTILSSINEQQNSLNGECPLWYAVNSLMYNFVPPEKLDGK